MNQETRKREFGRRLDIFMETANVSGAWVGQEAGCSQTVITRARRGIIFPSRIIARRIALSLNQPIDSFDDLYLPDNLDDEVWKPLNRHPEYSGSNKGRILNPNTGRVMKTEPDKRGYSKIQLHVKGEPRTARVHDLINETFNEE